MESFLEIISLFVLSSKLALMEEIRKIAKNQLWFRPIVEKARINYKNAHKELVDFDENKLDREQFRCVSILQHRS